MLMNKVKYNPCPSKKVLMRMGFYNDQMGIINRYINEKENWDGHLCNSKSFIIACLSRKKYTNVVVLGSGWLLDLPMDYILQNCTNIYLMDINHPRQILHKYRKDTKVHFVHSDITGGAIEKVYQIFRTKKNILEELGELDPPGVQFDFPVDFVISLNVMCQLDILIVEYMRRFKHFDVHVYENFRRNIQKSHIKSVQVSDCCLITDFEELVYDRINKLVERNNILYTVLPGSGHSKEWIWKFDTQMTYYPNRKTYFNVKALNLLKSDDNRKS